MPRFFDFLTFPDGSPIPVEVLRNPRARNIGLRCETGSLVVLTLPLRGSERAGLEFLRAKTGWVRKNLNAAPAPWYFAPGVRLTLLGRDYELVHAKDEKGGAWCEEKVIKVCGELAHFSRRTADLVKKTFLNYAASAAKTKAKKLGAALGRVSVRDQKSRWGSCTASGDIALSWRLALAPEAMAEYVIAHEVCHLLEMNHSPRFWKLIYKIYDGDVAAAKQWLKKNCLWLQALMI